MTLSLQLSLPLLVDLLVCVCKLVAALPWLQAWAISSICLMRHPAMHNELGCTARVYS